MHGKRREHTLIYLGDGNGPFLRCYDKIPDQSKGRLLLTRCIRKDDVYYGGEGMATGA